MAFSPLHQVAGSISSAGSGGSNVPHGRIVSNGSTAAAAAATISRPGAYSISRLVCIFLELSSLGLTVRILITQLLLTCT